MHPTGPQLSEETPLLAGPTSLKNEPFYIYLVAFVSAIGGFLFGYDTGIISGAMIFIRDHFELSEWLQEGVVSITLLAAWMFSILSGSATDRMGRKPVIIISSLIFVTGSVIMSLANDVIWLMTGRFVVGAGVGLSSMTIPMYIAEVAPSGIRGQLVMVNIIFITGGQFIASVTAYWLSLLDPEIAWRLMLGLAAVPAAIQFFAFLVMPESPRWLISNKHYDEAKSVLRKIRPPNCDIETEFEFILANQQRNMQAYELSQSHRQNKHQSTFSRILESPAVSRALLVGCLLQLVQQFSGINTVMYYTASIFQMSGIHSKPKALLMSCATSFVNFIFTLVGFGLVEKIGRRKLTLSSLFGVTLALFVLGAGFHVAYVNSPQVTAPVNGSTASDPCLLYEECSLCSRDPNCGFCYSESSTPVNGTLPLASCVRVDPNHHDRSLRGQCSSISNRDVETLPYRQNKAVFIWAYEWCPSSYSWFTLVGLILYLMFYAPGMGPMPWTINSEIYPSWARSWCLSASTSVCWLSNMFVSMTFLSLTRAITKQGAFYFYGSLAFLGFIFFFFNLPETKGKSLEQLESLFSPENKLKSDDEEDEVEEVQAHT